LLIYFATNIIIVKKVYLKFVILNVLYVISLMIGLMIIISVLIFKTSERLNINSPDAHAPFYVKRHFLVIVRKTGYVMNTIFV